MAKALFGHTSPLPDVRLFDEVGRLRRRLHELERELAETRADNERISSELRLARMRMPMHMDDDLMKLSQLEHASI